MDAQMWADQTQYVLEGNPGQFNFDNAYGHPGTTIVMGTASLHGLLKLPFLDALYSFMALSSMVLVILSMGLSYKLWQNKYWAVALGFILIGQKSYEYATPPSIIGSLLAVNLALMTLLIIQDGRKPNWTWGLLAGLLIATRFDIGTALAGAFLFVVFLRVRWKATLKLLTISISVFILADNFMWTMPIQHLKDLVYKIVYHYSEYPAVFKVAWLELAKFYFPALVSIAIGIVFVTLRKRFVPPFPVYFIVALLGLTFGLGTVFLTAKYQSIRYFLPLNLIWQMILPVLVFSFISQFYKLSIVARSRLQAVICFFIVILSTSAMVVQLATVSYF